MLKRSSSFSSSRLDKKSRICGSPQKIALPCPPISTILNFLEGRREIEIKYARWYFTNSLMKRKSESKNDPLTEDKDKKVKPVLTTYQYIEGLISLDQWKNEHLNSNQKDESRSILF